MHKENAFKIKGQQLDEIVIPEDTVKENFTVYVEDSIDRNEETLAGTDSLMLYVNPFYLTSIWGSAYEIL